MGKGYPHGASRLLSAANSVNPPPAGFIRLRYPIVNQILTVAAAGAGVGFGSLSFGLPEGFLYLNAATVFCQLATTSANISNATFGGNFGVGTIATVAGALTTTEVNLVPSTALPAAVAKVTTGIRGVTLTPPAVANIQDNHSKTMSMFLNVAVNAADITDATSAPLTVNGFIDLVLMQMGDN